MNHRDFLSEGLPSFRDASYKDRGATLATRWVEYGCSIASLDSEGFPNRADSHGDLLGAVMFPPGEASSGNKSVTTHSVTPDGTVGTSVVPATKNDSKGGGSGPRAIPGWWFACPSICTGPGVYRPILDKDYLPDDRFGELKAYHPPEAEKPVKGSVGIIISASKEDGDADNLFLPIFGQGPAGGGGELICPNSEDADYAQTTQVWELDGGQKAYPAGLNTAWRICVPSIKNTSKAHDKEKGEAGSSQSAGTDIFSAYFGAPVKDPGFKSFDIDLDDLQQTKDKKGKGNGGINIGMNGENKGFGKWKLPGGGDLKNFLDGKFDKDAFDVNFFHPDGYRPDINFTYPPERDSPYDPFITKKRRDEAKRQYDQEREKRESDRKKREQDEIKIRADGDARFQDKWGFKKAPPIQKNK